MPPLIPISSNLQRRRPGPKPKPLSERNKPSFRQIKRVERSYKDRKRVEVLLFLLKHRVPGTLGENGGIVRKDLPSLTNGYRPPTFFEASQFFKIPERTIKNWWKSRDKVVTKEDSRAYTPRWPDLEDQLYQNFLARRKENRVVLVG